MRIDTILAALDPISIANQAADKDFRWWFLALLGLVMTAGLWALRFLTATLMRELTTSRENAHARYEKMQAEHFLVAREVTAAVVACQKVIEGNTRESEQVRKIIEQMK